jgi:hypothetical protein
MARPTMTARVAAAVMRIPRHCHVGMDVSGCRLGVLPIRVDAVSGAVAAGEGTEQGQALIVGVRRLNFFAVVDAVRSGFRLRRDHDQRGYEYGGQNGSQGFILLV